jgi:hypothetical protein
MTFRRGVHFVQKNLNCITLRYKMSRYNVYFLVTV